MLYLKDHIESLRGHRILLSYEGALNVEVLNSTLDIVEETMQKLDEHLRTKRKVYNLLVECLQNVYHHRLETHDEQLKRTLFSISRNEKTYHIYTGNFLHAKFVPGLKKSIDQVNKLDRKEIVLRYREVLDNGILTEKGGSGLGFLDMVRKSKNPLAYRFFEQNDHTFFVLHIKLETKQWTS